MGEFNRLTVVAAAEVASSFQSHSDMEVLEVQWGIAGRCSSSSKSARVADWARIACEDEIEVLTESGYGYISAAHWSASRFHCSRVPATCGYLEETRRRLAI